MAQQSTCTVDGVAPIIFPLYVESVQKLMMPIVAEPPRLRVSELQT